MDKKLLILGVDPGSTLAYALLDLEGNLIKLRSSKNLSLSSLIFEIINYGRIVLVGTDVYPAPNFVSSVCSNLGAKLIYPENNLLIREKRRLLNGHKVENKHEMDALASAMFAYKKIRPLLKRVDKYLKKNNKLVLAEKVKKELLIEKGLNLERAVNKAST